MKQKKKHYPTNTLSHVYSSMKRIKESNSRRKERLELSGCMRTRVIKSKKAYSRKEKYRGNHT